VIATLRSALARCLHYHGCPSVRNGSITGFVAVVKALIAANPKCAAKVGLSLTPGGCQIYWHTYKDPYILAVID
jgi:hypothetical protein